MSPADIPPVPIAQRSESVTVSTLDDGSVLEVRLSERTARVTLPTPEQAARHAAATQRFQDRMTRKQRKSDAIKMKLENPKRSYAEIAREMNVSASSLSKWVKAASAAA